MVVDDEEPIRKLHMRMLARLGCSCREASSAKEALEHMRRDPAEILFLDLNLDRKSRRVGKECRSRWSPYH